MSYSTERRILLFFVAAAFVALGVAPVADRFTWFLENLPVLFGLAVLFTTDSRFKFSRLAYRLMALHALILMIGGHWTYAEVPIGDWFMEIFGFARNHYDRVGHFAQGFVPAIIAREVLLRTSPLTRGKWLFFLCTCVCLAFSALYELVEWWVAVLTEGGAVEFLGTQGDVWDTQWDMFLCTVGALSALLCLRRTHDRSLLEMDSISGSNDPEMP